MDGILCMYFKAAIGRYAKLHAGSIGFRICFAR